MPLPAFSLSKVILPPFVYRERFSETLKASIRMFSLVVETVKEAKSPSGTRRKIFLFWAGALTPI